MTSSRKPEWSDNDQFWLATYPFEFNDQRLAVAKTEVTQVLKLVHIPPHAAILDMACGPGRHSLELGRRGYRVTGVDLTAPYIDMAEISARRAGLRIEYILGDSRDFERPRAFNLVLNLFTSFGYFESQSDDLLVLRHAFNSLRPGGQIVIDTVNAPLVASQKEVKDSRRVGDATLEEISVVSRDKRSLRGHWTLKRPGAADQHFHFSLRLHSAEHLSSLVGAVGFKDIQVWGGLSGGPYQEDSPRLVLVATK